MREGTSSPVEITDADTGAHTDTNLNINATISPIGYDNDMNDNINNQINYDSDSRVAISDQISSSQSFSCQRLCDCLAVKLATLTSKSAESTESVIAIETVKDTDTVVVSTDPEGE